MERLGMLWLAVGAAWAVAAVMAASDGKVDLIEAAGLFGTGASMALIWAVQVYRVRNCALKRRDRVIWWLTPVVSALGILLAASDLPLTARLLLSAGALKAYAGTSDPDPPNYVNEKSIGLFRVEKVWRDGTTVAFVTGSNVFDLAGVVYAPGGIPTQPSEQAEELLYATFTHLYGPWYRFEILD